MRERSTFSDPVAQKTFEPDIRKLLVTHPGGEMIKMKHIGIIRSLSADADWIRFTLVCKDGLFGCALPSATKINLRHFASHDTVLTAEGILIGDVFLVRHLAPVHQEADLFAGNAVAREAFESLSDKLQKVVAERLKNAPPAQSFAPPVRFFSKDDLIAAEATLGSTLPAVYQAEAEALVTKLSTPISNSDCATALKALRYFMNIAWRRELPVFDLPHVHSVLSQTHYGMEKVKREIMRALAAYNAGGQDGSRTGLRLHLTGVPGSGKSSIARSLANALNLPCCHVALNGVDDGVVLHGTPRNYDNGDGGKFLKEFYRIGSTYCVMLLDEIDEMDAMHRSNSSDPGAALLDLLDESGFFTDQFLEVPIDVSNIIFIATSNDPSKVPHALRDRMLEIEVPSYSREEKIHIARNYIAPRYLEKLGLCDRFQIDDTAFEFLVDAYGLDFGLRDIDKALRSVCNDTILTHYGAMPADPAQITAETVKNVLGPAPPARGNFPEINQPGLVRALAVSDKGGLSFPVEVSLLSDGAGMRITGLPSDVVTDSCKLALTNICRHMPAPPRSDLHIHFGEGAVRKDGPSAGVSIFMAMMSAMLGQTVPADVCFTGEIDLFGNVFAVGGIRKKIEAAKRAGCTRMVVPMASFAQAIEENDPGGQRVTLMPVRHLDELVDAFFTSEAGCIQHAAAASSKNAASRST